MPFPNPETQFPPGQSGNPSGYSRKRRLTDALVKLIEEKGLDDPFVKVGMQEALKGDFKFWAYIFDRIDGKMKDELEIKQKHATEGPLTDDELDGWARSRAGEMPDSAAQSSRLRGTDHEGAVGAGEAPEAPEPETP